MQRLMIVRSGSIADNRHISVRALLAALISVAAAQENAPPSINFDVPDGRRFYQNEIILNVTVSAHDRITELIVDGADLTSQIIPGLSHSTHSVRIALPEIGMNEVIAKCRTESGREAMTVAKVERVAVDLDADIGQPLTLYIGNGRHNGNDGDEELLHQFIEMLGHEISQSRRFGLMERSQLDKLLSDQEIAALSESGGDAAVIMDRLKAVDLHIQPRFATNAGYAIAGADPLDVATSTTFPVIEHAFRLEPDTTAALAAAARDFALRLEQAFPRIVGEVTAVRGNSLMTTLTLADGVRSPMRVLIVESVGLVDDPAMQLPIVIGEGYIRTVTPRGSVINISELDEGETLDRERLLVVTK